MLTILQACVSGQRESRGLIPEQAQRQVHAGVSASAAVGTLLDEGRRRSTVDARAEIADVSPVIVTESADWHRMRNLLPLGLLQSVSADFAAIANIAPSTRDRIAAGAVR